MTLTEAMERFATQLAANGRSDHTIAQYRRFVGLLERWMQAEGRSTELVAVSPEVLAQFLTSSAARDRRNGGARKTASMNATRSVLRTFLGWCHAAGYVNANPARLIQRSRIAPPAPRGLSETEVQRLLAVLVVAQGALARRDHLLVHLLLATGIRIGSAIALNTTDVGGDEIRLRSLKCASEDTVLLGREIREHLAAYVARVPKGPLFRASSGVRLDMRQARRRIAYWFDRAEIHGRSAHGLRHTYAQRLLRRTGDLFLVKRALLHRSITSTAIYLNAADDRLREVLG